MKGLTCLITIALACVMGLTVGAAEADQLKGDLIGQTMGGREKTWHFRSPDQIKELVVKNRIEDQQRRVYSISLLLQATNGGDKYAADAKVEYWKAASGWKIDHVGLLSLKKIE
jgi:hypothetical protein